MEQENKQTWEEIGRALYEEWANREPFRFSPASDPAYTAQRDALLLGGERAMRDTVARAAAATGGYGNSFAVSAGEEAYRKGIAGLSDVIPALYDLAFSRYKAEGDALYDRMRVVNQMADDERSAAREAEKATEKAEKEAEKEAEEQRKENASLLQNSNWPEGYHPDEVSVPSGEWRGVSADEARAVMLKAGVSDRVVSSLMGAGDWTRKKTFSHPDVTEKPEVFGYERYEDYLCAYVNAALAKLG